MDLSDNEIINSDLKTTPSLCLKLPQWDKLSLRELFRYADPDSSHFCIFISTYFQGEHLH